MSLLIQDLDVELVGNTVLRNVNVHLQPGQTVAVVGRNGAGKTTLLRAIMGLIPANKGYLSVNGTDITKEPGFLRAQRGFGYAPEDRVIFPTLTVQQNITLPCEVQCITKPELARRLESTLVIVPALKPMLARSGAALSGGQGKIVALARALMVGTHFVFLDEPFQGLAPALARQYGDSLKALRETRPQLCVVVTESNASLLDGVQSILLSIERGAVAAVPYVAGT